MLRNTCVLSIGLCLPLYLVVQNAYSLPLDGQLDRPYVAFLETNPHEYSQAELKSLHSKLKREQDRQLDACRREEERLRKELDKAREQLKAFNALASRDHGSMAERRANLHDQIAALEQVLRNKTNEREHAIPAAFEIRLARLELMKQWPERRLEVARKVEAGRAREREHGDVEDIGYRKLVENPDQDIALGQQAARQMTASGSMPAPVENTIVQEYVRRLAGKIAESSDLKVPLHVTVLDSPEINAIALPGGYVYVTTGLVRAAETESQLAGVLSHQVASIAARHATRGSKRSVLRSVFGPAAQVATGLLTGGITNTGALYGMNYGLQGLSALLDKSLAGSGKKYQREADQLGIQYMWKAGYDPKGLIAFLDSIAKQEQHAVTAGFLRTNSELGARLVDAFSEIRYLPPKEHYTVDSPDFQKAKEQLR